MSSVFSVLYQSTTGPFRSCFITFCLAPPTEVDESCGLESAVYDNVHIFCCQLQLRDMMSFEQSPEVVDVRLHSEVCLF